KEFARLRDEGTAQLPVTQNRAGNSRLRKMRLVFPEGHFPDHARNQSVPGTELRIGSLASTAEGILECSSAFHSSGFVYVRDVLCPSPGHRIGEATLPLALHFRGKRVIDVVATVLPHYDIAE